MFLKSLKINKGSDLIREINFKKGLNIIIDETKTLNLQESGNNIGKTTVLRLIDFCLGGDGVNVYKDTEFKDKTNTQIETFLIDEKIVVTLVLIKDIDDDASEKIIIRKNFLKRTDKIQEINGNYYNDANFDVELKKLIFQSSSEKPTFRQIIAKNIRYEKGRLENTLKVFHYSTTLEAYEAIYFFWLGIDTNTANRKQHLQTSKSTEEAMVRRLRREGSLSQIKQSLSVIERDIEELDKKKSNFNINESYESDLKKLNELRANLNTYSTRLNQQNVRKDIILESKKELENEFANIDIQLLESIYKSAQVFVPTLHVKFTEMVTFHNEMLKEKIKFISSELPLIEKEITSINAIIKNELVTENELSIKLKKSGAIAELEEVVSKLNMKYEQKGMFEEQQRQWENSTEKLKAIEGELDEINEGIANQDKMLENRISSFNKFFSKISDKLYGEQFILSHDKNERTYELKISTIGGNLGTGKKKGQIAAFDISYIKFCDDNDLPCLHFILHDQIENIHDNQLTLIKDVVNNSNIQFIVPVLRDKLPPDINPDQYMILSLSQNDKLFKLN